MKCGEEIIGKIEEIDLITSPRASGKDILGTEKLPRHLMIGQGLQLSDPVIVDIGDLFMDIEEVP